MYLVELQGRVINFIILHLSCDLFGLVKLNLNKKFHSPHNYKNIDGETGMHSDLSFHRIDF